MNTNIAVHVIRSIRMEIDKVLINMSDIKFLNLFIVCHAHTHTYHEFNSSQKSVFLVHHQIRYEFHYNWLRFLVIRFLLTFHVHRKIKTSNT